MGENSKRNGTDIEKVQGVNADYLAQYVEQDTSLDALKEHRVVPRVKVIQPTSDMQLKKNFGEGTVIVRPGDALISKFEAEPAEFDFVPLFFFVEWAKWRDLKDKSGSPILDRTHDAGSDMAMRAKDADLRQEVYEGDERLPDNEKRYYRYVEHLRFIGLIYGDHPLVGTPITLSFERGEWGQGKNFISAIMLRRQQVNDKPIQIPLWAQVWTFSSKFRNPDADRKWFGLDFEPAEIPIIPQEEAANLHAMHKEFAELFEQQRLTVQDEHTDPDVDEEATKAHEDF
jgi:hypothetical protein